MAVKAGRVGVDPSQVTLEGKIKGGGVSPEVLTKEEARRIYQTILGMQDYLSKTEASSLYQRISDMVNYQLKLVSGTNIKRINGEDLLGSGNISVLTNEIASGIYQTIRGMSAYALKSELPDTSDLLTKTEAPGYDDILTRASASLLLNNKLSVDGSSINVMPTGSDVNDMIGGVSFFPGGCLNTPTNGPCLVISGGDGSGIGIQLGFSYSGMALFFRLRLSQTNWSNWSDLLGSVRSNITALQGDITTIQGDITTIEGDVDNLEGKSYEIINDNGWIVKKYNNGTFEAWYPYTTDLTSNATNAFGTMYASDNLFITKPSIDTNNLFYYNVEASFTTDFSFCICWNQANKLYYKLITTYNKTAATNYRLSAYLAGRWS